MLGIAYAAVENRVCERLSWLGIGGLSSTKRIVSHLPPCTTQIESSS